MGARLVSVIGGASATDREAALAAELGGLLAREGFTIVCGGGSGVMLAACRGAAEAGGATLGILRGTDPAEANPYVTIAVTTGLGSSRNRIVALSGSAVVAVGGGYGTLSEIAFALQAGRPVCALVSRWGSIEGVTEVRTPAEALAFVIRQDNAGGGAC